MRYRILLCLLSLTVQKSVTRTDNARCHIPSSMATKAKEYIGSTRWSGGSYQTHDTNTYNSCTFVAHVLAEVHRGSSTRLPLYRWWGLCWDTCTGVSRVGDVIVGAGRHTNIRRSEGVHMGIVTGHGLTTCANDEMVVENDWGFRSGQTRACWRYTSACTC